MPNTEPEPLTASAQRVHVAAAVIFSRDGQVLLAKRPNHLHQGGLWEFPGGKLDGGESVEAALYRELKEELSIEVEKSEPLIQIHHDYPDKQVLLDFYRVTDFAGEPVGNEGQLVKWVPIEHLADYAFPEANRPVVAMLVDLEDV